METLLSILLSTNSLTPWSRVLLEKLKGPHLVNKFPPVYGPRSFITTLTSVRHLPLSRARSIPPTTLHPTSLRSVLILSSHLRLSLHSGLFASGLPTKLLNALLLSLIRATRPAHRFLLNFNNGKCKLNF
jgi:hypothetical protein